ncbi:cellulase family glycosylhydrolase [Pseudomonas subflava]|uniref:cellulase family glycosylhydrolase n=1 Tax=Pseudomonas subflava TaxID=2952933 RepID=UPI002079C5A6|nr:cellulase family glycosylhydrolase [Pseudomonas subflava]
MSHRLALWVMLSVICLVVGAAIFSSRDAEAEITSLKPTRTVVWNDYLGVNAQFHFFPESTYRKQMVRLRELDLEWVRIAMHWAVLEPKRGEYFRPFDEAALVMSEYGLKPVGFLAGSAPFATSAPNESPYQDSYPPTNYRLYSDSLTRFIERYPNFQAWQIWNEPNLPSFWRPREDPDAYAALLADAVDTVRRRFPDKPLGTAGMAYFSQMPSRNMELMLKALLEKGLASKNLIVSYHPYTEYPEGNAAGKNELLDTVRYINDGLRGAGIKQIWATEWGWSSYAGPEEAQAIIGVSGQADYTLRRLALMSALDFDRIFLFNLSDLDARASIRDQSYGLLDLNGDPKPVFNALKNFLRVTGPKLSPADPPSFGIAPKDLYSVAWKRDDGRRLLMVWSASAGKLSLQGIRQATLHDPLTGKAKSLTAEGDVLTVPLKPSLQLLVTD